MKLFATLSMSLLVVAGISWLVLPGTLDQVGGLPVHPLIVHSVVVLVPLLSLLVVIGIFSRPFFRATHLWVLTGLGLTTIAAIASKSSGESLREKVSVSQDHVQWGDVLVPVTLALFVGYALVALFRLYRPMPALAAFLAFVVGLVAVGATGLTFVVGHSGAQSVWTSVLAGATSTSSATPSATAEPTTTPTPTPVPSDIPTTAGITLAQVQEHNTLEDCWTIVGDGVYDLTSFANRHPGGMREIERLCGTDGTDRFTGKHGGQAQPESELSALRVGDFAG